MRSDFQSIDHYIQSFPVATQAILEEMRAVIRAAAPEATEKISYQIPTFDLNGNLVHFAAFEKHIGFYPGAKALVVFAEEVKHLKTAKGSIQFPIDQPMPYALVTRIVQFRVAENAAKNTAKPTAKPKKK